MSLELDEPTGPLPTIHIQIGGREAVCASPRCTLSLAGTSIGGSEVWFWAEDVQGRKGVLFIASVRVIPVDQDLAKATGPWYVQVLSSQWSGDPVDACAVEWDTFPPLREAERWISSPQSEIDLATHVLYHRLAADLIRSGAIDISACPDGGLIEPGAPSPCGLEKAAPPIYEWQNRFDPAILDAARALRLPPELLKNLIAQESQFWPGSVPDRGEYSLGHLTEAGAGNTLLWNKELFSEFCPTILSEGLCNKGYAQLSEYQSAMLRGSLIAKVNADCPDCQFGIDMNVAVQAVPILAKSLQAYCFQAGRMVYNVTGIAPGRVSSYEDMWRITLASYAAGPGCVADALRQAHSKGLPITWASVSQELPDHCTGAVDYVRRITQ